jgi:hypothetical protein
MMLEADGWTRTPALSEVDPDDQVFIDGGYPYLQIVECVPGVFPRHGQRPGHEFHTPIPGSGIEFSPFRWLRQKLTKACSKEDILDQAAAIGARYAAPGQQFEAVVTKLVFSMIAQETRSRQPAQNKLLKDPEQKIGMNMPAAQFSKHSGCPNYMEPGLGVVFDVDWGNVTEFQRVLFLLAASASRYSCGIGDDWRSVQLWGQF